MIKGLIQFLGGEPGEEKPMLILLGKGFFMGIFLASYQIGAETLFLNELGENYLDVAFFTAGGLGILATTLYVKLQERMNFSSLVVSNVFLTLVFLILLRLAFSYPDIIGFIGGVKALPFILFVMIGPITAVTLLGFWGIFGRMFDLKQSKRIIGGIDTGQLSATILAFFSIPFLNRLGIIDQTYDLLLMAAISVLGMFVFAVIVVRNYNLDKVTQVEKGEEKQKVSFAGIFVNPYLRMMAFFILFSMAASVFMNYTFYTATETYYPEEADLRDFLSFFNGAIMLVSFFIQSLINDWIISNWGLRIALMMMPLILILFTLGSIISGNIFGYSEATIGSRAEFLYFFLFTALGKLFTASLKDALENPAFKLFFLPLDRKIRFDVQTRIEGVINEFATLSAGALQIGLGLLAFFELIHYTYFVVALGGVVIYLANKLFGQYKITLKNTLEIQKLQFHNEEKRDEVNIINALRSEALSNDPEEVINSLKILEKIDPIQLEEILISALQSERKRVRYYAYVKLNELLCFDQLEGLKDELKYEDDPKLIELGKKVITNLEKASNYELKEASIKKLVRSTEASDRILAARLLSRLTQEKYVPYLMELLRDINNEVRIAAMVSAGKLQRPEFWPVLIENLHLATYGNISLASLVASGEDVLHLLDTAFYKSNQHPVTMFRVIQIIGRIGGYRANDLLWKKIDFPNKRIVSEILNTLSYLGFEAKDFQKARIKIFINSIVGNITWNLKVLEEIPRDTKLDRLIREAIEVENQENYSNIFMLLSMIYDPQSVLLIKENIEVGTSDSITFAIEMLDIFVEDELKPILFPALDDSKIEDKLAKLHDHYAPEYYSSYEDLLLQIINRDYNFVNKWTKALAVYRIGEMEDAEVSNDLIANVFNPDVFLRETICYAIYKKDKEAYHYHTRRINPAFKKDLDKAIVPPVFRMKEEDYHQKMTIMERALFLKSLPAFENVHGIIISEIAQCIEEVVVKKDVAIIEDGDPGSNPLYIVVDGSVKITKEDGTTELKGPGEIIGEKIILANIKFDFNALTAEESVLFVISKEEFFDLLTSHIELVFAQLNIMAGKKRVVEEDQEEATSFSVFGE